MKQTKKSPSPIKPGEAKIKKSDTELRTGSESAKKNYPAWFYSIPFILIILFFVALEGGLRLFNYGKDIPVFRQYITSYPDHLFFNPEITEKYFTANPPSIIFDGFRKEKLPNTVRIFVLGESSAAGWPYHPNSAFPRYIRNRLESTYPDKYIEVINLGVSAISTFTLRDILPEVLQQKPDMILIYTGHNEFYGALGVASTQSLGKSRMLINFLLSVQKYRVVQLIQNSIRGIWAAISPENKPSNLEQNTTLMERVIGESSIPLNSDLYKNGLKQFEGNMRDILEACKDAHVPVVLGNLACNLKDQKPFITADTPGLEAADKVYSEAQTAYASGDYTKAKALFMKARDLDALRFRASTDINVLIKKLADEFKTSFVDVESALNAASEHGITGKELMVDHLHPNVRGYQLIGKAFYESLQSGGLLPAVPATVAKKDMDSLVRAEACFTALDSLYADLRLRVLLGAYPFVPKGQPNQLVESFTQKSIVDSLAYRIVFIRDMAVEEGHYELADVYLKRGDVRSFEKELNVLISENILDARPQTKLIKVLLANNEYDRALPYLFRMEKYCGNGFSAGCIGAIYLNRKMYKECLPYLEKAAVLAPKDAPTWYNAALAYFYNEKISESYTAIKKALELNPRYSQATEFKQMLEQKYGLR